MHHPNKGRISSALSAVLSVSVFLLFFLGLLRFPNAIRNRLAADLSYCLGVLIPSLFPFVAFTTYATESRLSDRLGKGLGFLADYGFHLPKSTLVPLIMGLIGGYPAGAAGVSSLLQKKVIHPKEAERMLCFCVNPGIPFVVFFLGDVVLKNRKIGWLLLAAILSASALMGIFLGIWSRIFTNPKTPLRKPSQTGTKSASASSMGVDSRSEPGTASDSAGPLLRSGSLPAGAVPSRPNSSASSSWTSVDSILPDSISKRSISEKKAAQSPVIHAAAQTAQAMIKMTACILLFSGILSILQGFGLFQAAAGLFSRFLPLPATAIETFFILLTEITTGICSPVGGRLPFPFYAFALAFGGICVHLQLFSFFEYPMISVRKFFLSRLSHGLLSAWIFTMLLNRFPDAQAVFFHTPNSPLTISVHFGTSLYGGLSLLLLCGAFLLFAQSNQKNTSISS